METNRHKDAEFIAKFLVKNNIEKFILLDVNKKLFICNNFNTNDLKDALILILEEIEQKQKFINNN